MKKDMEERRLICDVFERMQAAVQSVTVCGSFGQGVCAVLMSAALVRRVTHQALGMVYTIAVGMGR